MRVYFLAEKQCALCVNGAYVGIVDGFERTCELEPDDKIFCELKPGGHLPVSFFFDEDFLLNPPERIRLYFLPDGVAVYASGFLRADNTLEVLFQKRLGGDLLTLYRQGNLQLNLENETGFHLLSLPDSLCDAQAELSGNEYLLEGKSAFAILSRDGKILVSSEGRVTEKGDSVTAEVPFHDSVGHTAVCTWTEGKLTACKIRSSRPPAEDTFALALFESVLVGGDTAPYLHESLAEKAGALKEFLGNFSSVTLTRERDVVGLVYERKPRVYDVRYFRVAIEEDKIKNVTPI